MDADYAVPMDVESAALIESVASVDVVACPFCAELNDISQTLLADGACHTCGSPLQAVPHAEATVGSRRAFDRVNCEVPVVFDEPNSSQRFAGIVENESIGGVRLLTSRQLMLSQTVRLDCPYFRAVGRVRYVLRDHRAWRTRWHLGIEFVTVRVKAATEIRRAAGE
jgi:hypothetical protein